MSLRSRPLRPATLAAVGVLMMGALSACGAGPDAEDRVSSTSDGSYPVTVINCGTEVTFERAPERVVLLKSAAVPYLHALGVMDRVTARAGAYPEAYYDRATLAELDEIPLLTDQMDSSGHLQISREVVIGQEPDLVLGEVDNLSRDSLDAVSIPLVEEPALCATGGDTDPSFDDVSAQMKLYGAIFGREEQATRAITAMEQRIEEVEAEVGPARQRTAAVLYPTVGGGTTYAYGTSSMAQPQLTAAGFTNVFDDVDDRVFEVTLEELLGRDPDVLVLLHSDGDPQDVTEAVTGLPGAEQLTAVRNGDVMTQLFNYTEPATPLAVEGLEHIVERFGS